MKFTLKAALTISSATYFCSLPMHSFAQEDLRSAATNRSLSTLFSCTEIVRDAERLACQDAEIKKLKDATAAKTLVVIDEKAVKDIKKRSFGFSLPKLGLPDFGGDSDEAVALTVTSVRTSGRKLTIVMENGQIWQSIESYVGYLPKRGKLTAKIKPASFGSFRMTISNEKTKSKGIRVRRLE